MIGDDKGAPRWSIWGEVQSAKELDRGIWRVWTAEHGGLMVSAAIAQARLSQACRKRCERDGQWHVFEEDENWAMAAHEIPEILAATALLSKGVFRDWDQIRDLMNGLVRSGEAEYLKECRASMAPIAGVKTRLVEGITWVESPWARAMWVSPQRARALPERTQAMGISDSGSSWLGFPAGDRAGGDLSCHLILAAPEVARAYGAIQVGKDAASTGWLGPSALIFDRREALVLEYARNQVGVNRELATVGIGSKEGIEL